MNLLYGVVAKCGVDAVKSVAGYASSAVSGELAVRALDAQVDSCAQVGSEFAGSFGKAVGTLAGKAIAGASIPNVKVQADGLRDGLNGMAGVAIDSMGKAPVYANEEAQKQAESARRTTVLAFAGSAAKAGFGMFAGAAVASGVASGAIPFAAAGLAFAGATAVPRIVESFCAPAQKNMSFFDGVVVPGAKEVLFEGISQGAGNIASFNQIHNVYDATIFKGQLAGSAVDSYLPGCLQGIGARIGGFVGSVDAGRSAMSDENVALAAEVGKATKNAVNNGLRVTELVVNQTVEQSSSTAFETAKKVCWVGSAVLTAGAMFVIAPEVAPFVGAGAMLRVSDKLVDYLRSESSNPEDKDLEAPNLNLNEQAEDGYVLVDAGLVD